MYVYVLLITTTCRLSANLCSNTFNVLQLCPIKTLHIGGGIILCRMDTSYNPKLFFIGRGSTKKQPPALGRKPCNSSQLRSK